MSRSPNHVPRWLLVVLCGCLLLAGCPSQQGQVRRRTSALSSPLSEGLGIWHKLTPFERQTVMAVKRQPSSTLELMKLALIFSGPRTTAQAAPFLRKYQAFVTSIKPQIEAIKDHRARGRALLRIFHTGLLGSRLKPTFTRYSLRQTRIDVLLQRGTFNCLSSAIVYGILALEFGFQVKIALMPTHAFVELQAPGSREWLPVETTAPRGFAPKFNKQYYSGRNQRWARSRGLRPATYAEYLARDLRSVRHVICRMALWNHLPFTWPRKQDQRRLREIAGAIDGFYKIQGNRLATWLNVYQEFHKARQYQAGGLFGAIGPALSALHRRPGLPLRLRQHIALLHVYWLESAWHSKDTARFAQVDRRLPAMLKALGPQQGQAAGHVKWLLAHVLDDLATQGKRKQGESWLARARQLSPQHMLYYEGLFWSHLGNRALKQKRWGDAASHYRTCLARTRQRPDKICQTNLSAAIHNWGVALQSAATDHARAGRFAPAIEGFRACAKQLPRGHTIASACQQGLVATYYNWAVKRYKAGDKAGALQKLQRCLQQPSPLPQCRQTYRQLKALR